LGWAGVIGYVSGFSSLRPRICQRLLFLATKDYLDRLLGSLRGSMRTGTFNRWSRLTVSIHADYSLPYFRAIKTHTWQ
jgi:hypothetical protein